MYVDTLQKVKKFMEELCAKYKDEPTLFNSCNDLLSALDEEIKDREEMQKMLETGKLPDLVKRQSD